MIPPDLPPVKNRPLYIYRIIIKLFSFFYFGLGTIGLIMGILPVMRLVLHPRERFSRYARRFVSSAFRSFIRVMNFLGIVVLDVDDPKAYRNLSSKIVVANHPSLLDVVMLISLIPNADCIVRGSLSRTIVQGVIKQLYISNSLSFDEVLAACKESLAQGNCLVIFPEGTRSPRNGVMNLKRGASRMSLASGCGIIPIHIGGTDKYGLGKRDPLLAFNPREKYVYRIRMQREISPARYAALPVPLAVRRLTADIQSILLNPLNR